MRFRDLNNNFPMGDCLYLLYLILVNMDKAVMILDLKDVHNFHCQLVNNVLNGVLACSCDFRALRAWCAWCFTCLRAWCAAWSMK